MTEQQIKSNIPSPNVKVVYIQYLLMTLLTMKSSVDLFVDDSTLYCAQNYFTDLNISLDSELHSVYN